MLQRHEIILCISSSNRRQEGKQEAAPPSPSSVLQSLPGRRGHLA